MDAPQIERPIYRHIIVKKKGFIEKVASPEQFRRLRQQIEDDSPIDDDIKHLVVNDTIKATMKKVMGWAGHGDRELEGVDGGIIGDNMMAHADAMRERKDKGALQYKRQQGVIVARLTGAKVPGGDEALPLNPSVLSHPGFNESDDPEADFLKAAQSLQASFEAFSDRKFLLLPAHLKDGCTLVTVAYTPILAAPRADYGLELFCEFHQTTRLGYVDTDGFNVISEMGEYPIAPPGTMDLALMMKTADDVVASLPKAR